METKLKANASGLVAAQAKIREKLRGAVSGTVDPVVSRVVGRVAGEAVPTIAGPVCTLSFCRSPLPPPLSLSWSPSAMPAC